MTSPSSIAYAYRLGLFLGGRSEQNTAYGMSHDLWTWVVPEYCAILNNVIISLASNSFQNLLQLKADNNSVWQKDAAWFYKLFTVPLQNNGWEF